VNKVVGVPGIKAFGGVLPQGTGCRGAVVHRDVIYAVVGKYIVAITQGGTIETLTFDGTLDALVPGKDRVTMAVVNDQIGICNGSNIYVIDVPSNLVLLSYDDTLNDWNPSYITGDSGFGLMISKDSQRWFKSPYNNIRGLDGVPAGSAEEYNGLEFALADKNGDLNVAILAANSQVYVAGTESIELWYGVAQTPFPYSRHPTSIIDIGVIAPYSLVRDDTVIYFLGNDLRVYSMGLGSLQPQRISNDVVEGAFSRFSYIKDAFIIFDKSDGQTIMAIQFPTENRTWCFHIESGQWFERRTYEDARWNVSAIVQVWGQNIVFPSDGYQLGELSPYEGKEWGQPLVRTWEYEPIYNGNIDVIHTRLWLDCDTGFESEPDEGFAANPIMLQISDDGGETWYFGEDGDMGKRGRYGQRVIWTGLGSSSKRSYRMSYSGDGRVTVYDTQADMIGGKL